MVAHLIPLDGQHITGQLLTQRADSPWHPLQVLDELFKGAHLDSHAATPAKAPAAKQPVAA